MVVFLKNTAIFILYKKYNMGKKNISKYDGKFYKGQIIGEWEVIDDKIIIEREAKIFVKCSCGSEHKVSAYTLINGTSTKCLKCGNSLKKEKNPAWKGHQEIPYSWFSNYFLRNRKRVGDITIQDVYELWIKQNKKCSLSGVEIGFEKDSITASIDRIDSKKEYYLENIQLVHKDVNLMKNYFDNDYFINTCHKISRENIRNVT
jgi:hypothetical protein